MISFGIAVLGTTSYGAELVVGTRQLLCFAGAEQGFQDASGLKYDCAIWSCVSLLPNIMPLSRVVGKEGVCSQKRSSPWPLFAFKHQYRFDGHSIPDNDLLWMDPERAQAFSKHTNRGYITFIKEGFYGINEETNIIQNGCRGCQRRLFWVPLHYG